MLASTACNEFSVNVCNDFKCLYEHEYLHLLELLLAVVVDSI
jgi:hypothetical protein